MEKEGLTYLPISTNAYNWSVDFSAIFAIDSLERLGQSWVGTSVPLRLWDLLMELYHVRISRSGLWYLINR